MPAWLELNQAVVLPIQHGVYPSLLNAHCPTLLAGRLANAQLYALA